jgi:hypothetical protein
LKELILLEEERSKFDSGKPVEETDVVRQRLANVFEEAFEVKVLVTIISVRFS